MPPILNHKFATGIGGGIAGNIGGKIGAYVGKKVGHKHIGKFLGSTTGAALGAFATKELLGSFKRGGKVPKTGAYKLHAGEYVIPKGKKFIILKKKGKKRK